MRGNLLDEAALRRALSVYFIMGSNNCRKDPLHVLSEAIEGGITLFQFREKGSGALKGKEMAELAWNMRQLCRRHSIPFIVNDDVDLALEVDADGVHVGQEDEAAVAVRRRIGSRILGVSAYNLQEAETAIRNGADYLGVGPLFATMTKEDAKAASGLASVSELRERGIRIPVVGIGGITAMNAGDVILSGADGVSVISAISMAEIPVEAASALKVAVREASQRRTGQTGTGR
ncbi:thiamine phosphate synthase [Gorillibacterium massiliense]|uniref:thiamine phosphate synthase n=1 Tax=Gorillibacterium massiliense TaxID=1280390 RepID=UPI0004AE5D84|nr:thiamine phosphate synthase [Gorillibacterium massiliense]